MQHTDSHALLDPPPATPSAFRQWVNRVLRITGIFFVVVMVIVTCFVAYAKVRGGKLDATSKAYANEAIPAIFNHFDVDEMRRRESVQFAQAMTDEKLNNAFRKLRTLGAAKHIDPATGQANINFNPADRSVQVTAFYVAKAEFESGPAEIRLRLISVLDRWYVLGFFVNSEALIK